MARDDSPLLPEPDVDKILRRAIEIDAHSPQGIPESAVREIARELRVSDRAVDRAMAEYRLDLLPKWPAPAPAPTGPARACRG